MSTRANLTGAIALGVLAGDPSLLKNNELTNLAFGYLVSLQEAIDRMSEPQSYLNYKIHDAKLETIREEYEAMGDAYNRAQEEAQKKIEGKEIKSEQALINAMLIRTELEKLGKRFNPLQDDLSSPPNIYLKKIRKAHSEPTLKVFEAIKEAYFSSYNLTTPKEPETIEIMKQIFGGNYSILGAEPKDFYRASAFMDNLGTLRSDTVDQFNPLDYPTAENYPEKLDSLHELSSNEEFKRAWLLVSLIQDKIERSHIPYILSQPLRILRKNMKEMTETSRRKYLIPMQTPKEEMSVNDLINLGRRSVSSRLNDPEIDRPALSKVIGYPGRNPDQQATRDTRE